MGCNSTAGQVRFLSQKQPPLQRKERRLFLFEKQRSCETNSGLLELCGMHLGKITDFKKEVGNRL